MALSNYTDDELLAELHRRGIVRDEEKTPSPRCYCVGIYDVDGFTTRCRGCLRAVMKCTC